MKLVESVYGEVWNCIYETVKRDVEVIVVKNVEYNPRRLILDKVNLPVQNLAYWSVFVNARNISEAVINSYEPIRLRL